MFFWRSLYTAQPWLPPLLPGVYLTWRSTWRGAAPEIRAVFPLHGACLVVAEGLSTWGQASGKPEAPATRSKRQGPQAKIETQKAKTTAQKAKMRNPRPGRPKWKPTRRKWRPRRLKWRPRKPKWRPRRPRRPKWKHRKPKWRPEGQNESLQGQNEGPQDQNESPQDQNEGPKGHGRGTKLWGPPVEGFTRVVLGYCPSIGRSGVSLCSGLQGVAPREIYL